MITAAPYGPVWMPQDCTPEQKLPVTWDEQTQAAVDCFNAGSTMLHIHVRDPKTGHISRNLKEYSDQIGRLHKAVPKMILQIGGSISFASEPVAKRRSSAVTMHATSYGKLTPSRIRSRSPSAPRFTIIRPKGVPILAEELERK